MACARPAWKLAGLWVSILLTFPALAAGDPFPVVGPATRTQAASTLMGGAPPTVRCLSAVLQTRLEDPAAVSPAGRRALSFLQSTAYLPGERRFTDADGTVVRFTTQRSSFDRIEAIDEDRDGTPDRIEGALGALGDARRVLVAELGLASGDPIEVLLVRVGGDLEGYFVPSGGFDGRPLLVLDASSTPERLRSAAIHQYAHAVALSVGAGLAPEWSEAFATWAVAMVTGGPDDDTASLLSQRMRRLDEGLESDVLDLAAGNAAWLSFLDESYGRTTLKLALEELGDGASADVAFDRAVRRSGGAGFTEAFRDFQLWSILTGDRSTGSHFSFAGRLESPGFASVTDGLPALSVLSEPPVAPLGAAATLLHPESSNGGVTVRFEGETPGQWDADLVLTDDDGTLHRIPLAVVDGKSELTIPVAAVREAILLVRNLDPVKDGPKLAYSWSARAVAGYPFETASLEATATPGRRGVRVAWETRSEQGLVGFNVLRREAGGSAVRVNPVWIPALGDLENPAAYEFIDRSAVPGAAYSYSIEGITTSGLASTSESVVVSKSAFAR